FQLQKKYIVAKRSEGLILVHQQRAHERVLYDSFLRQFEDRSVPSQVLAFPIQVDMNQQQFAEFSPHQKTLELMGFSFGNADANNLEITAIHNSLFLDSVPDLLSNFLEEVENDPSIKGVKLSRLLAKTMAKHGAIRAGADLHQHAQSRLIKDLFLCDEPSRCPNGKLIFVSMTTKDLENKLNV
ncbi:MAG: hypothetical protein ACPH7I_04745, partial [Flavobacteriaceae bacterium]